MARELSGMVYMLLLICIVLVGISGFIGNVSTNYGGSGVENVTYINRTEEIVSLTAQMENSTQSLSSSDDNILGLSLIDGILGTVQLLFGSANVAIALVTDLVGATSAVTTIGAESSGGIGWILPIITALIAIYVTIAILSAFLKWEV